MIRACSSVSIFALIMGLALASTAAPSLAATAAPAKPKPTAAKAAPSHPASSKSATPANAISSATDSAAGKPLLVGSYGDWGAYAAKAGTTKTCYALAQPKDRQPSDLKRDQAYIFIANRPAENVHDEVSIIMGFDVKGGEEKVAGGAAAAPGASAEVGSDKFTLVAKGGNLWLENLAREGPMLAAMRKNGKLVVQAMSMKGHVTSDTYSLSGFAQALDRMHKECR